MRISPSRLLSIALCLFAPAVCGAQATDSNAPKPSAFQQLFPNPSGQNGYEELVMAGDLIEKNPAVEAALADGATLSDKRRAVSNTVVGRALSLLKTGLAKPVLSPHQAIDYNTTFPELRLVRQLGKLLTVDMYVAFADGRTVAAIDDLKSGLSLGYAVQQDCLIGGLVGIAVETITLNALFHNLDQLSARDCDRLMEMLRVRLTAPDPSAALLDKERQSLLGMFDAARSDPNAILPLFPEEKRPQISAMMKQFLTDQPGAAGPILQQTVGLINAQYEHVLSDLQKPYWERKAPELPKDGSLPTLLLDTTGALPSFGQVTKRYGQEQALLQMLGVHAAIHRFRWEHDRLPNSLDELHVQRWTTDPFTGAPLIYKRTGERTYDLSSAGLG